MSQDSIGVVTTGRRKLQEWKTTQKRNLSRKSRGTLTVKWAGSRDKTFSLRSRENFFLDILFYRTAQSLLFHPRRSKLCQFSLPVKRGNREYARSVFFFREQQLRRALSLRRGTRQAIGLCIVLARDVGDGEMYGAR